MFRVGFYRGIEDLYSVLIYIYIYIKHISRIFNGCQYDNNKATDTIFSQQFHNNAELSSNKW
jgi:hypothetical protein